jgi:class 3 adenylate cyclase
VTVEGRDSGMRVSDAEREAAIASLRGHFETGRLTFDEFGERVDETYAAKTDIELQHALRELPRQAAAASRAADPRAHPRRGRRRPPWQRWVLSRFVFVNGICVSVWAASGAGYFWPVWVMIPTGAIFLRRMADHASHDEIEAALSDPSLSQPPPPRPASEPQNRRVVMTVLYVDIVGSTAHAVSMGDAAWNAVLADYERRVDAVLEDLRGEKLFTKGDEVVAGFFLPASAVECGLRICAAARELGLEVRAGIHAGEVDRIGNQANGIAMHIGRRVCEVAGPSQVLVSSTVRDLLAGSSLTFAAAGEHQLKGLNGAWQLYEPSG